MKITGTNFHRRSIAATQSESKLLRDVLARYEAARRWSSERSYIPGFVQDHRFDANEATRFELVRKSRWFEKNDALANRLGEVFVEFTVGANGPPIMPASSDDEWNQRAGDWLAEWYSLADITTRFGYGGLMTTAAWRRFFDGEFFLLKTFGEDKTRPRLQGISAHRVATPPDKADQEGKTIIEGIEIDSRGRPVAYWIQEGIEADQFTRRTSNEIIHIFEPESPGQYRGLPMLTPVMNDLHDFSDLFMLEMQAAKLQAKDAVVYKNVSGELSREGKIRESFAANSGSATTQRPDDWKQRSEWLQKVTGARVFGMRTGEEAQFLASNRPSVTTQWFFDYQASRVCTGIGFSKQLVFPWSIQGTIARGDYDLARNFFLSRFAPFQSAAQQIYWFVIGVARFSDPRIADAPADWTKCIIRPPRAVNVDVGRNSAATIAELDSCLTTLEEQFAMRGLDWREQTRQRAREEAFINQTAEAFKITPARIRTAISDVLKTEMETESAKQSQQDAITA